MRSDARSPAAPTSRSWPTSSRPSSSSSPGEVRAAALAAMPPPAADLSEMKRVAKEKLADGNTEDVIHDLLYNVPREKLDAEALDLLAQAYEKQGKFTEAAKIRASGPDAPKAPPTAPGGARPQSGGVAAAPPAPATDYLSLGRAALARGDALNAQSAANRLLEIDPQSSDAYRLLGNAYALRGEKAFAEATLRQSLKYNAKNEGTLLDLYELSLGDKNWDAALDALRRATEVNPAERRTTPRARPQGVRGRRSRACAAGLRDRRGCVSEGRLRPDRVRERPPAGAGRRRCPRPSHEGGGRGAGPRDRARESRFGPSKKRPLEGRREGISGGDPLRSRLRPCAARARLAAARARPGCRRRSSLSGRPFSATRRTSRAPGLSPARCARPAP